MYKMFAKIYDLMYRGSQSMTFRNKKKYIYIGTRYRSKMFALHVLT